MGAWPAWVSIQKIHSSESLFVVQLTLDQTYQIVSSKLLHIVYYHMNYTWMIGTIRCSIAFIYCNNTANITLVWMFGCGIRQTLCVTVYLGEKLLYTFLLKGLYTAMKIKTDCAQAGEKTKPFSFHLDVSRVTKSTGTLSMMPSFVTCNSVQLSGLWVGIIKG